MRIRITDARTTAEGWGTPCRMASGGSPALPKLWLQDDRLSLVCGLHLLTEPTGVECHPEYCLRKALRVHEKILHTQTAVIHTTSRFVMTRNVRRVSQWCFAWEKKAGGKI